MTLLPYLDAAPVRIYYEQEGHGSLILLLHNYFGTHAVWAAQRTPLRRQFRTTAVDLRGHGRSLYAGRLRLVDLIADVVRLIEDVSDTRVHVVGCSLGALVGLGIARDRPDLVHTLTVIAPPHLTEPTCRAYMSRVIAETFPANAEQWEEDHRYQGPHHVRQVLIPNFAQDRDEPPPDQQEVITQASRIACPTLVVGGDNDPVFPVRRAVELGERVSGAELCILPRAGHLPHRTQPDLVNAVLLAFLERRASG